MPATKTMWPPEEASNCVRPQGKQFSQSKCHKLQNSMNMVKDLKKDMNKCPNADCENTSS